MTSWGHQEWSYQPWHVCSGSRVYAGISLLYSHHLEDLLLAFQKMSVPDTLPFPTTSPQTSCMLPCWQLSPWETMSGGWPVIGLEVGKALNTHLSASFPLAPP